MGFEGLELITLQQYWWVIISVIGGLFVFIMFVQGGQSLIYSLSESENEKTMLINALGRKWELGFTTLVLFGGALFAAFPLFYATSFGGAYWVWLAILFCFIIQAVSYEYRRKPNNLLGQKVYESFLFINGTLGVFLLGVAIATFFSGSGFRVDEHNFSHWISPWRGLEALANPFNYLLGFALVFLTRISGALYYISIIDEASLRKKAIRSIKINMPVFLLFFLSFMAWILTKDGFAVDAKGVVFMEAYKYLHNFLEMPLVLLMFLGGVVMVVIAVYVAIIHKKTCCIKTGGTGIVLTVTALLLNVGLNHTAYYPSTADLQSSLTIANSSGSHYTLAVMGYVSFMVPFVLAYIAYAWYSMDKVKLTQKEIDDSADHLY